MEESKEDISTERRAKAPKINAEDVRTTSEPPERVKYVAIRPRPPAPPEQPTKLPSKHLKLHVASRQKKCPVPICKRADCKLQTHRSYGIYRKQAADQSMPIPESSRSPSPLLEGDVSGLPQLPLGDGQSIVYRTLFHEFFGSIYDRIAIMVSPPPLSSEQKMKAADHKKAMLHRALEMPVYCLNYVASSFCSKPRPSQYRDAVILHGRVMQLFRENLAKFSPEDVDDLLVVILTLVILSMAVNNYDNLHVHRTGMEMLVKSRGGMHNLDSS